MKKIYVMTILAACAMMVFSCKNNNKENEAAPADAVENCCEDSTKAGDDSISEAEEAAKTVTDAAKEAVDRAGEALEKLDGIQPYTSVEVKPTFNGGDADSFVKYVQSNLQYPQSALENNESGKVTVNFVVDAKGKIQNAKVVKGVSPALDAEALRVINSAPDWTPAKQGGMAVPVTYSIPVTFAIR